MQARPLVAFFLSSEPFFPPQVELQLLYPAICAAPEPRVLDVGCGTGWLTAVLADLVPSSSLEQPSEIL